ncbi:MAG: hypothetical protein AAF840_09080 [Bacteroidota bacterium]
MRNEVTIRGRSSAKPVRVTLEGKNTAVQLAVETEQVVVKKGRLAMEKTYHRILICGQQRIDAYLNIGVGTEVCIIGMLKEVVRVNQQRKRMPDYCIVATRYVIIREPQKQEAA